MSSVKYKFADFTFDAGEEILCKNDERLTVSPKSLCVLELLLENAGTIVKKEEFFERVWAGAFVEDNNLTVAVAQIRRALGETRERKFIETAPKKGYCFAAPVERIFEETKPQQYNEQAAIPERENSEKRAGFDENFDENLVRDETANAAKTSPRLLGREFPNSNSSRNFLIFAAFAAVIFSIGAFWRQQQQIAPVRVEPLKSIAVLPFVAENASPDEQIFAEKLTQDLTHNLGRISDARVAAYEAVAPLDSPDLERRKIGGDLQVEGLITGKIKSDGGAATELEIEINDLRAGAVVWQKRYVLNRQNLAESQYRVAGDIAREFGRRKEAQNPAATANYEAYQSYLLARHDLNKGTTKDYEKAIENFTRATVQDASFADAHSGLAIAHILHGINLYAARGLSASRQSFPAAIERAERALELKPDSDEALTALAFTDYRYRYDWARAETNFKRAVEINPNNVLARRWRGEFLHHSGRFDEGFAEQRSALALEPNSGRILSEMAWGAYLAGRFDEAVSYAENARDVDKNNASALYNLSEIYEKRGDYAAAAAAWKEAMTIEEANRKWIANLENSFQKDGYRGFARAKTEWLENLSEKDYVYPTDLAKGYAALGENDKAVEWLKKAVDAHVPDISSIGYAPAFDRLRGDARFQTVVKQINFPQ